MKKSLMAAAIAATLGLAGASVQATTLYFDAFGGFVTDSFTGLSPVTYGGYVDPVDSNLRGQVAWGTSSTPDPTAPYAGQSYMGINEWTPANPLDQALKYAAGDRVVPEERMSVVVDSPGFTIFGDLTHFNHEITSGGTATVEVGYTLDLYENALGGPRLQRLDFTNFILDLWETTNAAPCPPGSTQSICDDSHSFGPASGTTPIATFNGYNVFVQGFFDKNGVLTPTFWSSEEGASQVGYVGFRLQTVPEPASIALLGLGLAGIGVLRRRRNQA